MKQVLLQQVADVILTRVNIILEELKIKDEIRAESSIYYYPNGKRNGFKITFFSKLLKEQRKPGTFIINEPRWYWFPDMSEAVLKAQISSYEKLNSSILETPTQLFINEIVRVHLDNVMKKHFSSIG